MVFSMFTQGIVYGQKTPAWRAFGRLDISRRMRTCVLRIGEPVSRDSRDRRSCAVRSGTSRQRGGKRSRGGGGTSSGCGRRSTCGRQCRPGCSRCNQRAHGPHVRGSTSQITRQITNWAGHDRGRPQSGFHPASRIRGFHNLAWPERLCTGRAYSGFRSATLTSDTNSGMPRDFSTASSASSQSKLAPCPSSVAATKARVNCVIIQTPSAISSSNGG